MKATANPQFLNSKFIMVDALDDLDHQLLETEHALQAIEAQYDYTGSTALHHDSPVSDIAALHAVVAK